MLHLPELTLEKVKATHPDLVRDLPEVFELKGTVENTLWHSNENVFDHTIGVLEKLEQLIKQNPNLALDEKVDNHTRGQLLFLSALLHDIAKKETFVRRADGTTSCKDHFVAGERKIKEGQILERFHGLTQREKELITNVVRDHNVLHLIVDKDESSEEVRRNYEQFKRDYPHHLELLLLSAADTDAGSLKKNAKSDYDFRMKFYREALNAQDMV